MTDEPKRLPPPPELAAEFMEAMSRIAPAKSVDAPDLNQSLPEIANEEAVKAASFKTCPHCGERTGGAAYLYDRYMKLLVETKTRQLSLIRRFLRLQLKILRSIYHAVRVKPKPQRIYLLAPLPEPTLRERQDEKETEWGRQWWNEFEGDGYRSLGETLHTAGLARDPESPPPRPRGRPPKVKPRIRRHAAKKTTAEPADKSVEV